MDRKVFPYPNPLWCWTFPKDGVLGVGEWEMAFIAFSSIPTLSLSVHSAERLSTNTDRTMFSLDCDNGRTPVVMNLTTLQVGSTSRST